MIKTTDVSAITSIVDLVLRDINDCHLKQNSFSHFCPVLSSQLQLGLETKRLIQFFPFIPHVHLGVSKNDQRFSTLETKSEPDLSYGCASFDLNSNINRKILFSIELQLLLDLRNKIFV